MKTLSQIIFYGSDFCTSFIGGPTTKYIYSSLINFSEKSFFNSNLSRRLIMLFLRHFQRTLPYLDHYKINWFRVVLFAGLGYKRKMQNPLRVMCTYISDRHWIIYPFLPTSIVFPIKKRDFIFVAKDKRSFSEDYYFFSTLRKPYVYKMKGFLDKRIKRRFYFVRRIKFRGIKAKLSKKQQLL